MLTKRMEPRWRKRLSEIDSEVESIRLPDKASDDVSQDEEWCEVVIDGEQRRIRFHDYDEVFAVPGLYENLFYGKLKCCSPSRVAHLLSDVVAESEDDPEELRVLDVGAGNGMVGDEMQARGVERVVGVDIIPEAREAALRDRPGVYDDYRVVDLTQIPESEEERIRGHSCNCLTSVAALGFGDIPPQAFIKALDLIETPGWIAFTIKEDFLYESDTSGFDRLIRHLWRDRTLQMQSYRRFRHRVSITGEPLFYVAMVARKQRELADWLLDDDLERLLSN